MLSHYALRFQARRIGGSSSSWLARVAVESTDLLRFIATATPLTLRQCDLVHMRRGRTGLPVLQLGSSLEGGMVVIQDIVERESIESQADSKASDLFSIAVFCGFGLLVSVSVLLLDQYVPGDWF